ncbi:hypothetical protein, conserved [Babesia bigemina]|uniref:Uncharacterized protein n=1 Tax=Babesia bigemina TaxID=5866 RepID=A0A061D5F0_BABBI|nr:hypothetical protein, conserved [Babesia bigemina]CDR95783.1 hypothetical protein, conserved [Babesia bigemina]|eukprot:XP_012767969.1 hypothetical protein, conserved [Babesia bigemina]
MWSLHFSRRLFGSAALRCEPARTSSSSLRPSAIESKRTNAPLKSCATSQPSSTSSLDTRIRGAKSLQKLFSLCASTAQPPASALSDPRLSAVGRLYALRIIDSSGVLRQPLGDATLACVEFAESATWHLLDQIERYAVTGAVSVPRSKHLVGLLWHSMKIASSLAGSLRGSDPIHVENKGVTAIKSLTHSPPSDALSSRMLSRWSLVRRCLAVVQLVVDGIVAGLARPNGKDVQQLLMLAAEPIFTHIQTNMPHKDEERVEPDEIHQAMEEARCAALRSIEVLAEQCAHLMTDSELVSVFVSCCSKDVSPRLISFLNQSMRDRAARGFINLALQDCVTLFNISKTYKVPSEVMSILLSQLATVPLCDDETSSSPKANRLQHEHSNRPLLVGCDSDALEVWHSSVRKATFADVGRLCRSLYHQECGVELLRNIDSALTNTLGSAAFVSRLSAESRQDTGGVNTDLFSLSSIIHLFAKNNFWESQAVEKVLQVLPQVPLGNSSKDELVVLGDLCWGMLTLRVDVRRIGFLLDHVIPQLKELPIKNTVKLMGGLYNSLGRDAKRTPDEPDTVFSLDRVPMDDLLAYTLNDEDFSATGGSDIHSPSVSSESSGDGRRDKVIRRMKVLRSLFMDRLEEVTDSQNLSNFMFYAAATIKDINEGDYNALCLKWLANSRNPDFMVKVEALSQLLWALQKNRIYHHATLMRIREIVSCLASDNKVVQLCAKFEVCSMGQLALMSHTLMSFNLVTQDLTDALLTRLEALLDGHRADYPSARGRSEVGDWDVKLTSVIWSIVLSDFTLLNFASLDRLIRLIGRINWRRFVKACRHQDLRKVLQIYTSLEVELPKLSAYMPLWPLHNLIPHQVISAAIRDTISARNSVPVSASQDRVRRSLSSFGVRFKGEYAIYRGITVDFAICRNQDSDEFSPDLVIEMDGPCHYNVICGEYSLPHLKIGAMRLLPTGKTLYRNRIIRKLGYTVESISWIDAHRRAIHVAVGNILNRHEITITRK